MQNEILGELTGQKAELAAAAFTGGQPLQSMTGPEGREMNTERPGLLGGLIEKYQAFKEDFPATFDAIKEATTTTAIGLPLLAVGIVSLGVGVLGLAPMFLLSGVALMAVGAGVPALGVLDATDEFKQEKDMREAGGIWKNAMGQTVQGTVEQRHQLQKIESGLLALSRTPGISREEGMEQFSQFMSQAETAQKGVTVLNSREGVSNEKYEVKVPKVMKPHQKDLKTPNKP